MDFQENDSKCLKTYQSFQFKVDNGEVTIPEQGDTVRSLMFQLYNLYESKKLTYEQYKALLSHHEQFYFGIVDEQDENKGINNYAEQSIQLASGFKNDSKNWKCSLTFESLDNFDISDIKAKDYKIKTQKEIKNLMALNNEHFESNSTKASQTSVNPQQSCEQSFGGKSLFCTAPKENTVCCTSYETFGPSTNGKGYPTNNYQKNIAPSKLKQKPNMDETDEGSDDTEFVTARQQFIVNEKKKGNYGAAKKSLGYRRGPSSRFIPPVRRDDDSYKNKKTFRNSPEPDEVTDERLKGIEPKMIDLINNEIMDHGPPVVWEDIAGLEFAKTVIKEIVVWPMLRPDIFKGLRGPPKGLLLFGPPGTGKTLIGKCIASQSKATFFSISASSLTSKWVGEGEKMVRALFAVARCHQPAVIFIDEIDSLLSQRSDTEHESSRRIKTEFLIQLDGATTNSEDRLLVVGATNRPQEIDEAARRRLVKRLYIPLPEGEARKQIITNLLKGQCYSLSEEELTQLMERSEGYSGSDMSNLCREAALGPIRSLSGNIQAITSDQVRPILFTDFDNAFKQVRASVSSQDLDLYLQWNKQFGSGY